MSRKLRKIIISIFFLGLSIGVIFMVLSMPAETVSVSPREIPPVEVEVLEIIPEPEILDTLMLPGSLEPELVVDVPAEVRGKVAEIFLEEGNRIGEGDLILKLDDELYQAEFDRVRAQSDYDERTYNRSVELLERGVLNKSEVEEAQARMQVSRANYQVAKNNLEDTEVYSPTSGVLNELLVEQGEYVAPGDTIAQIVDVSTLRMVIQVPERDVQYVRMGLPVVLTVDAQDARKLSGKVIYISQVADESTRTTRVEITVDNRAGRLHSGMIVRANLPRRVLRDVVMIPLTSVIPLEEGRVVYVVSDGEASRRNVELGMMRGSKVQVLAGLQAGDQLIVAGHRQVGPGQKVRLVSQETSE